ncbi:MAG: hypothetical protein KDD05_10520 [Psychroserpens sp.]|nr:hypothetical protein [Psychroserpens sp.]
MFKSRFRNIFDKANAITISIEDLKSIDRHGVTAIAQLHNESILKQKSLSIIGLGCQEVFNHFKTKERETTAA